MERGLFDKDHDAYRETVRAFLAREVAPGYETWEEDGLIPREVWRTAGRQGIIGLSVPERLGGGGTADYRYRVVVAEEIAAVAATSLGAGLGVQDDIVIPYLLDLGTEAQRGRWVPGLAAGELIGAIAMTEPDAGSDLRGLRTRAVRDGDGWRLSGQKTFISNGIHADVVVVAAVTDPDAGSRSLSLFVVLRGDPGFERGRKLAKVGLRAQDTAELFFDQVRLPADRLLGTEGRGLAHLMERLPLERLSVAVQALASATAVHRYTRAHCFERRAFGRAVGDFQHTRFVLAETATELDVTQAYVDRSVLALNHGDLSAVDAAKAKWWTTELHKRVVDRCVQLHGGAGYMLEHPVARAFVDSRAQTVYAGTTEIMKEIIGRDLAR
ncbi:long-chain-acyl-CoA dehydrogenase [Streptomyces sp. DvalAA-14]|uniref:acyl-CoA dehydrogenase family protein n=1 Tax=unclassified Streptomyces TaxID=2593676 RepID=UPI00081B92AC|nr:MULTISPECIES: acyl-CoA dehydrogenase family protein [unclassified Streptomyces]MYS24415.1 acyl-CoA dehydrogenase [Streptomyces sp. SID4948]SCE45818.1 long-chain-acyl-CoA dehydrogenase [Streptomyces sp. DvalAA-14]